jgi:hypothetical protein
MKKNVMITVLSGFIIYGLLSHAFAKEIKINEELKIKPAVETMYGLNVSVPIRTSVKTIYGLNIGFPMSFNID